MIDIDLPDEAEAVARTRHDAKIVSHHPVDHAQIGKDLRSPNVLAAVYNFDPVLRGLMVVEMNEGQHTHARTGGDVAERRQKLCSTGRGIARERQLPCNTQSFESLKHAFCDALFAGPQRRNQ